MKGCVHAKGGGIMVGMSSFISMRQDYGGLKMRERVSHSARKLGQGEPCFLIDEPKLQNLAGSHTQPRKSRARLPRTCPPVFFPCREPGGGGVLQTAGRPVCRENNIGLPELR